MTEIDRGDILRVMQEAVVDGETPAERNAQRRAAVVIFLSDKADQPGLQGSTHDMILDDLDSYKEWEDDGEAVRVEHSSHVPWLREGRPPSSPD